MFAFEFWRYLFWEEFNSNLYSKIELVDQIAVKLFTVDMIITEL